MGRLGIYLILVLISCGYPVAVRAAEAPRISVQTGHGADINALAFSPDGKLVVTGGWEGPLILWEVSSGRKIRAFSGHRWTVYCVAFSPDGRSIASASRDQTVKLWDVQTGREVRTLTGHLGEVWSVAFSPDGKKLISGGGAGPFTGKNDDRAIIWDVDSGRQLLELSGHGDSVHSVRFSRDGLYAFTSGSNFKAVWSLETGKQLKVLNNYQDEGTKGDEFRDLFDPSGRYVYTVAHSAIIEQDVKTGKIRKFTGSAGDVEQICLSPDGRRLFAIDYASWREWDVASGSIVATQTYERGNTATLAISPDGRYLAHTGVHGANIHLWDLTTHTLTRAFKGRGSWGGEVRYAKSGTIAVVGGELWDVAEGQPVAMPAGIDAGSRFEDITPDGHYALYASPAGTVFYVDLKTRQIVHRFDSDDHERADAGFLRHGAYLLAGAGGGRDKEPAIKMWDLVSMKEMRVFDGWPIISPDGRYILKREQRRSDGELIDLISGKHLAVLKHVDSVMFSPDSASLAAVSYDDAERPTVVIYDMKRNREIKQLTGFDDTIFSLNYADNGASLAIGGGKGAVWVYDAETWRLRWTSRHHEDAVVPAFSPDGSQLISGSHDSTIIIWNADTGVALKKLIGHEAWVTSVAVSPDGTKLLSNSMDNTTRLWDIAAGNELARFIRCDDNDWLTMTPTGYYTSSPKGDQFINVAFGLNVYPIENFGEAFYRPDLVKLALSGSAPKGLRSIEDVAQPPNVQLEVIPSRSGEDATVKVKLTDQGGGVGNVRLLLNGSAVLLDNGRGLKIVEKRNEDSLIRSYTLKLGRGVNTIRAVAFNAENTMQSNPVEQAVSSTFVSSAKPTLHALVVGINEFKNPKLRLQYAVPDAELFAETVAKGATGLFDRADIVRLTTPEETTTAAISSELRKMQKINPEDIFIFFVASHGTVDDGEYFLITSNVGSTSTSRLKIDALSQNQIKELLANIPATKKVIVLDTCNAGQMGDAIQVAMLTRGMSEDAAFKILSRAVGSTILSSATSTQEALEGYQGHGLFTWVLTEGMKGKADKGKTGLIKTTDLVDYVESEVPEIAEQYFKRKQYPTTAVRGQGFPIGRIEQ